MTVVVFSVKPRARIAPHRQHYREIVAQLGVRRDQKRPPRVPSESGRPLRQSRRRWARTRGHYRRFACGHPWRGETSREAAVSASDGAREAGLRPDPLLAPRHPPPPRGAARRDQRLSPSRCVCVAKARRRRPRSRRRTRCENRRRHRAPRESQYRISSRPR